MEKTRVEFKVFRRIHENEWQEIASVSREEDDFDDIVVVEDPYNFNFHLVDDPEYAAKVSSGSVVMPWVTVMETGDELQLSISTKTHLIDEYYAQVVLHYGKLPRAESEFTCGQCLLFSHEKGAEVLLAETHTFAEGEKGYMNAAIVDAMAETYSRPTLSKENVGYCPKHKQLVAIISPACDDIERKPE